MLTFRGSRHRFCDGISRRGFLQVGALAVGGLTLPSLLRLRARAAESNPKARAVIMIYLAGGPSHIDMYDLKPKAPAEIRGEFRPIQTNLSGFDICELMPLQAQIADKLALIRSMEFKDPFHSPRELLIGIPGAPTSQPAKRPAFGSVVSRLGRPRREVPAYVSLMPVDELAETAAYLGAAHQPFRLPLSSGLVGGPAGLFKGSESGLRSFQLNTDVTLDRLSDRQTMLRAFDTMSRDLDANGSLAGMDSFNAQAIDLITANKARAAFDLSREPASVRSKYGVPAAGLSDARMGEKLLLARRLVEAGVQVVTVSVGTWDTHGRNFSSLRKDLPVYDKAVHALVTDLHERGLDKDVLVLVWGEFGRSPQIGLKPNAPDGRGHWPSAGFALLAGGGLRMGQVIGATDRHAARPITSAVTPQKVLATMYHALGIDPSQTLPDRTGRPMYVLDEREPIDQLI